MVSDEMPAQADATAGDGPTQLSPQGFSTLAIALLGISLTILNAMFTTCTCGHYSWLSIPASLIALWMVWSAFAWPVRVSLFRRLGIAAAVVVATYAFLSMVLDFLWDGHDALFEYNPRLAAAVGQKVVFVALVSLAMLTTIIAIRCVATLVARCSTMRTRRQLPIEGGDHVE